jgi:hypothetical protein
MIIRNMPMSEYHDHDAVSSSKLAVFRESPLLYKRTFIDRVVTKASSAALREGAGFDCCLFDGPEAFAATYVCKPPTYTDAKTGEVKPWNGNSNVCKAWLAAAEAQNKVVLDSDAIARFALMREAIRKHPLASALLSQGEPQVTFRREAQKFGGLEVQVRPDWFSEQPIEVPELSLSSGGRPYLLDLKTTADFGDWFDPIDPHGPKQGKPVWTYGYHRQAGFAQWVVHKDVGETAHFLLVVEKDEPYRVGIIQLSNDYLDLGWAAVEGDLTRLAACRATNTWPGSPESVLVLKPPLWLEEKSAREAAASA